MIDALLALQERGEHGVLFTVLDGDAPGARRLNARGIIRKLKASASGFAPARACSQSKTKIRSR